MQFENTIGRSMFALDVDLTKNTKLADTLFLMTVGVLLAWSLVSSIISNTAFTQDHIGLLMRMILAMTVLRIIFHNKYSLCVTFSIIAVASAMFAWDIFFAEEMSEASMLTIEFISGVVNFAVGVVPHTMAYEQAITWALIIAMGLFVIIFSYVWFNFFVLLGVSVFAFGISLNYGLFTYAPSFYAFVLCTLANLIKYLHTRQTYRFFRALSAFGGQAVSFKGENPSPDGQDASLAPDGKRAGGKISQNSYFALYALPMIVVCILAALVIPKPAEGFAQRMATTLVTSPLDRVTTFIHAAFRPKHFSLSQTGFGSGSRRLGGDVVINDDVIMRIRADGPVYLTGNVLDTYTGYAWVNSLGDDMFTVGGGTNVELLERVSSLLSWFIILDDVRLPGVSGNIYGIGRFLGHEPVSNQVLQYYLMSMVDGGGALVDDIGIMIANEIEVNIGGFRTFSAFYTGILSEIEGVNTYMQFMQDHNGTIITDALMPRNATYRFVYHELAPMFDQSSLASISYRGILRDTLSMLEWRKEIIANRNLPGARISVHETRYAELLSSYLIPHADWVYEVYTQLPENFPERVRTLAQNITASAESDYERARMIESYLLTFEYTLTPGPTPADRDFVDYFLFDLRKGYCTSFASAFVTMVRSVGLPARYVEGFNVAGYPDSYGYINVTNEQGHAWGEVYFEGFGWKRFEPTPGGGGIPAVTIWDTYAMDYFWYEDLWWDEMFWGWGGYMPGSGGDMRDDADGAGGTAAQEAGVSAIIGRFVQAAVIVFIAIIVAAAVRAVWIFRLNKRAARADNGDAVVYGFYAILKYLKFFKIEISQSETAVQFANKIDRRHDFAHDKLHMKDVAKIFSKARYSGHAISPQERETVERALRNLDAKMLGITGRARYLYYKYILAVV